MTKRKKQIEIIGFTKASNLLPKDKKPDNKTTPIEANKGHSKTKKQDGTTQLDIIQPDTTIDLNHSNDSSKSDHMDDTFFNSTTDENEDDIDIGSKQLRFRLS